MPKANFSRSKDKILISMVRTNPMLYDDRHDQFRNLVMKQLVWENISAAIDMPIQMVKKRWRHFRDHYLKKYRDRAAGRGRQTWEYMERLEFLAFLARGTPRLKPPRSHAAQLPERVIYVVPPGEHDSFSEPEDAQPAAKRRRSDSPETVEICSSPTADAPELHVSSPCSEAPGYSACTPESPPPPSPGAAEPRSPVHKFFEAMADIVAQFPPALAAAARLQVCRLVNELEEQARAAAGAGAGCSRCQPPAPPD